MTQPGQAHDDRVESVASELPHGADLGDAEGIKGSRALRAVAARPVRGPQGLTETITSTARIPGPPGFYYADVPIRSMAMIIDIMVLSALGLVLTALLGGLVSAPGSLDRPGGELDIVAFAILLLLEFLLSLVYFCYLWVALRATLGMRLLGLQIGDESLGHSIRPRQAVVRWLIIGVPSTLASLAVYVPSLIGLVLSVLGLAWLLVLLVAIARSPAKQGLHDRYAHSVIVTRARRST